MATRLSLTPPLAVRGLPKELHFYFTSSPSLPLPLPLSVSPSLVSYPLAPSLLAASNSLFFLFLFYPFRFFCLSFFLPLPPFRFLHSLLFATHLIISDVCMCSQQSTSLPQYSFVCIECTDEKDLCCKIHCRCRKKVSFTIKKSI